MIFPIGVVCGLRIILSSYISQTSIKQSVKTFMTQNWLDKQKTSMLFNFEKMFYLILPQIPVLYNLCMCALDTMVTIMIYFGLRQFIRYSLKPQHRFNETLLNHTVILVTASPLYLFLVPYQVTHLQFILFIFYIISLFKQQLFFQILLAIILVMFNRDFVPVAITSILVFSIFIVKTNIKYAIIRVTLFLVTILAIISLLSLVYIITNYHYQKCIFNPFRLKYIFQIEQFQLLNNQFNNQTQVNVFSFIHTFKYVIQQALQYLKISKLTQNNLNQSDTTRTNIHISKQIVSFIYYLLPIKLNKIYLLNISSAKFSCRLVAFLNLIITISTLSLSFLNQQSLFLLIYISSIFIYFQKKLDLNKDFGFKKARSQQLKKAKAFGKKQKRLCVPIDQQLSQQKSSDDNLKLFNDVYNTLEGLQVVQQLSVSKQGLKSESNYNQDISVGEENLQYNTLIKKIKRRVKEQIQLVSVQTDSIVLMCSYIVGCYLIFCNFSGQSNDANKVILYLSASWIALCYHADQIFVKQLEKKHIFIVCILFQILTYIMRKYTTALHVVQNLFYFGLTVFVTSCQLISVHGNLNE